MDIPTVAAAAVVAWSVAIAGHQAGHALIATALGASVDTVTALGVTGRWGALRTPGTLMTSVAGTSVNMLVMAGAWGRMRPTGSPGLREVVAWLLFAASGWTVAGHLVLSPVIGAGDWMTVVDLFANRGPLRASTFVTGLFVCGVIWKGTHETLAPVTGGGPEGSRVTCARRLTRTAWVSGTVSAALAGAATGIWGPSDAMLTHTGQLLPDPTLLGGVVGLCAAFIGFGLMTAPTMLAPVMVKERPVPGPPLEVTRSVPMLITGVFFAVLLIGALGPGVTLAPH
ncbi:MAG: hypothetical protein P8L45_02420 [Longimicrobiales bacterium]|nr:hypothetical protein [Longimicrobiales bacterium]